MQFSGISLSLPQNVNLLTLEPWKDDSILIRFEHLLERNDDPSEYSKAVTFNLLDVFKNFDIYEIRETTLAGNQWIDEATRFTFKEEQNPTYDFLVNKSDDISGKGSLQMTINLDPLGSDEAKDQLEKNETKTENQQNQFNYLKYSAEDPLRSGEYGNNVDPYVITLEPMQIRTFVIAMESKP